jgi:serine/threonine-protein kinase
MQIGPDQWVLTDFGVAAMSSLEETVSNLTSTGATLGTFAYMSPEQISGGEIDGRADLYSMGVVMYQALIGRLPFVGDNTAVVLSQQLHTLPIEPHLISPSFPKEIEAVLMKTLSKRPEHRYQNGAELAAAFNDAFDALSPDRQDAPLVTPAEAEGAGTLANIPVATVTEPPADKRVSRRLILGVVAAVLVAIAACVVIVMPLQAQLAEAQGTAAALGSRTPVIVTQMVTNAAGEQVFIMVTAAEGTPSATPEPGSSATQPGRTPTTAPTQTRAAPTATAVPATASGGSSGGQGGATVEAQPTSPDATAPGNSGDAGTPGGGTTNGNSGGSNAGGNDGGNSGGNNAGGNNGGGNNGGGNGNGGGKSGK